MTAGPLPDAQDYARRVCEEHGRTYALATKLLPGPRSRAIHGLYAWARTIDDFVDLEEGVAKPVRSPADVEAHVHGLHGVLMDVIAGRVVKAPDWVADREWKAIVACADAVRAWGIEPGLLDDFLAAMLADLPGTSGYRAEYRTWAELDGYMWGSACVIGLLTLPVLSTGGGTPEYERAQPHAAELGRSFQLTNFIRDIAEDLDRGRIYLPLDEWARFGVTADDLRAARAGGAATPDIRAAVAYFIAVNRASYREAEPGIAMLRPPAREAIRTAYVCYSGILDRVEAQGLDPFTGRAVVPVARQLSVAVPQAGLAAVRAGIAAARGVVKP